MLKQFQSVSSFLIFLSVWVFSFGDTKKIHSIDIILQGPRTVSESFIRQNLQVEEGAIFRESSIDKSIRNLMDSGTIQDVKVYLDPDLENDEKVALVFKVKTKARVGEISFNGNDKISDKKLSKSISTKLGQMLDLSKVNADLKVLEDLYLEKGYWNIRIKSQVIDSTEKDEAKLVFEILENEKRKISKISFIGNVNLKKDKLLDVMETAEWRFWRFWSARSKYRPRILEDDLEKLKEAYRNEGFLGVRLEQNNVRIIPYASKSLELQIEILRKPFFLWR